MAKQTAAELMHSADECAEVAKAIEHVAQSAALLLNSHLNEFSLALLIREALPRGVKSRVSHSDIVDVLHAAANLTTVHLRSAK